jgi:uncharacterized tellurite resistance protein B-like protein
MLDRLRQFVTELAGGPAPEFAEDDHRIAAAALLIHLVNADGIVEDEERAALRQVIRTRFGLNAAETERLLAEARARAAEAVDFYSFTSVLKRLLDRDDRLRVVEMMWEIVYADGAVSEFEDNIVWRVAELLGIEGQERIALKHRIAARMRIAPAGGAQD